MNVESVIWLSSLLFAKTKFINFLNESCRFELNDLFEMIYLNFSKRRNAINIVIAISIDISNIQQFKTKI